VRVAVLMDNGCASSCEEFLLTVRQGFAVKLVGRRSRGSLDYSNLRPYVLPSAERVLRYAISRSLRLPDLPVDLSGVEPDIYLPAPSSAESRADEVLQVRHWLEGGTLAPTVTTKPKSRGPNR
jgi:C-terminal processing protease CtpA/Prc